MGFAQPIEQGNSFEDSLRRERSNKLRSSRSRQSVTVLLADSFRRIVDVLAALALLALLLPIMLVVGCLIRLSSKGPAIYLQRRLTRGGKVFTMFKFRTMAVTAEKETGAVMAKAGDMRVTPLGRLLRRTRLDELPQLINVLIGDMSLIGPRPERPEIARKLQTHLPDMPKRLMVKAGLTGWAQIKCGYASCPESYRLKLDQDIYYVENRSLWLDFKIAVMTVWVILSGHGAR